MATHRDSAGRTLADYPRPSVAVDTAVLTVAPEPDAWLGVLLVRRAAAGRRGWSLPGTFVHPSESLSDAVLRSLSGKAGVRGVRPRQLHVFDRPDRDDRGWVMSVAHLVVMPWSRLAPALTGDVTLVPVDDLPALAYDHREIVARASESLRADYATLPDPDRLLWPPFTLLELRRLHEAVAGRPLGKDTFRRHMEPQLRATGEVATGVVGKPARLFRRR